jgi:hypothetical protein
MIENTVGTTVVPASRLKAFVAKVTRPFRRFSGTPFHVAEQIMGPGMMHQLHDVCTHLGHSEEFLRQHGHLARVPYTERELRWASENGVILTLHSIGVRRLARIMRKMEASDELLHTCRDADIASPRHPYWRLVLRPSLHGGEIQTLRNQPKDIKKRQEVAPLGVAVTAMYLDRAIYGRKPDGLRRTASTILHMGATEQWLLVGSDHRASRMNSLCVVAGRSDATRYLPVVMWRPHPVHPLTLY